AERFGVGQAVFPLTKTNTNFDATHDSCLLNGECANPAILLANVFFSTTGQQNPPALRAAPFRKGGFQALPIKGETDGISPAVSPCTRAPRSVSGWTKAPPGQESYSHDLREPPAFWVAKLAASLTPREGGLVRPVFCRPKHERNFSARQSRCTSRPPAARVA